MEKKIKEEAERLKETTDTASLFLSETRLQFDTLVQLQMQERQTMLDRDNAEKEKIRKHYGRIIAGLVITLMLIIGSIVGAVIYLLNTYDFITDTTYQSVQTDNNGYSIIFDGIHAESSD